MTSSPSALDALIQSYLDLRWHFDPVNATAHGVPGHDHRLGRFGPEEIREHVVALKALEAAVEGIEIGGVEDEIDRTALLNEIRVSVHQLGPERVFARNPEVWVSHVLEGLFLLLVRPEGQHAASAAAAAERLEAIPGFLEVAAASLEKCPPVFIATALDVIEGGMVLIDRVAERLRPAGTPEYEATVDRARSALQGYAAALRARPPEDEPFAIGEDAFRFRLRYEHALESSPDALWSYGVGLIKDVQSDVERLARAIDPGADWRDTVSRLRDEYPSPGELVGAYQEEMARARRFVEERHLVQVPEGDLVVTPTPDYLAPLIPFAAYQPPGAFAGDRTGLFYVTVPNGGNGDAALVASRLRDHCHHEIPGTALHEGYPGHHLQFLRAHRQPRAVRKVVATPVTVEGWALYCEEMMAEEGFFQSHAQQLFQKVALLWRAARIVLDVGLHTQGMTFEGAVKTLVELVMMDRKNAEAEVRRYCGSPGYQLSYAVGRREFLSLRNWYRDRLGTSFTPAAFHDAVLEYGGLPPRLIRWGLESR